MAYHKYNNTRLMATPLTRRNLEHPALAMSKAKRKSDRELREQSRVRKTVYSITQADPTNIVSVRRGCCRFCWGENHEYQRTDWELDRDVNRFIAANNKRGQMFNKMGGGGYVKTKDPNPKCPLCLGEGESYTSIQDFRKLSQRDRALIAGVKIGKNGMVEEIRFHDKIAAITVFAKLDGMIIEKRVVKYVDATEQDLDEYFKTTPITLDNNDPTIMQLAQIATNNSESTNQQESMSSEPEAIHGETRLERLRRLRREGVLS